MIELTVSIKGAESSYKQKFLVYEQIKWTPDDPTLKQCVEEALGNAKIEPEDIKIRALMVIK